MRAGAVARYLVCHLSSVGTWVPGGGPSRRPPDDGADERGRECGRLTGLFASCVWLACLPSWWRAGWWSTSGSTPA